MKKFLSLIFVFILSCSLFSFYSCNEQKDNLSFYAPDGAPALSIAQFVKNDEDFSLNIDFDYKIVASSSIATLTAVGTPDLVILPVTAASKLYNANKNDPYKFVSVITHGNLYLVGKNEFSLTDLQGQVVGVIGQGLVPDLTLKTVLNKNGIAYQEGDISAENKITLRYFDDASSLMPLLKQGVLSYGLLPEPAVTKLSQIESSCSFKLDLQELYDGVNKTYPQAILMVKESVLKKYSSLIQKIKDKFSDNLTWTTNNIDEAVLAVNSNLQEGVTPSLSSALITPAVIENCKIFWQDGEQAKTAIINYISDIINTQSNAAKQITQDFFI